MKSQAESVERLVEVMRRRRSSAQIEPLQEGDEEWTIKRSQFYGLVNSVLDRLNITEQQVSYLRLKMGQNKLQNKTKDEELVTTKQEIQRMKHLLPIKETIIKQQRIETQKLEARVKELERELNERVSLKTNGTTRLRLDQLEDSLSFDHSEQRQSSSICRTKRTAKVQDLDNHQRDLEMAKLRTEITKLQATNRTLTVQSQLLKIQNQHLVAECQMTNAREREITFNFQKWLSAVPDGEVETWSQKCSQLELFVDRLAEKANPGQEKGSKGSYRYEGHPPTPHFSSSTAFCFSKRLQLSGVEEQGLRDEVSLGDLSLG